MDKKLMRKEMMRKRGELSKELRLKMSNQVFERLSADENYIKAKKIFVFVSFGSEIYTHDFIKNSILNGKEVYIPHIENNQMHAVSLKNFDDLEVGFYNILSLPEDKIEIVDPKNLDLILVPGLIFDMDFYRIGYGGGYYDKYLSNERISAKLVGICFDFQIIDSVDPQSHDVPVDKIVTEIATKERN